MMGLSVYCLNLNDLVLMMLFYRHSIQAVTLIIRIVFNSNRILGRQTLYSHSNNENVLRRAHYSSECCNIILLDFWSIFNDEPLIPGMQYYVDSVILIPSEGRAMYFHYKHTSNRRKAYVCFYFTEQTLYIIY